MITGGWLHHQILRDQAVSDSANFFLFSFFKALESLRPIFLKVVKVGVVALDLYTLVVSILVSWKQSFKLLMKDCGAVATNVDDRKAVKVRMLDEKKFPVRCVHLVTSFSIVELLINLNLYTNKFICQYMTLPGIEPGFEA